MNPLKRLFVLLFIPIRLCIAVTPDLGHGATVTFQSGILGKILSIDWSGIAREAIPTTVLDTSGGKTFTPGDNYDLGELVVECQFDTDAAWNTAIAAAAENTTVTFGDSQTWMGSGFLTNLDIGNITNEGVMTSTATIKFTGSITLGP